VLAKIAQRPVEPLNSSYYPSPSTVLNLMRYRSVSDLRYIIERSLASFYDRNKAREMVSEAKSMLASVSPQLANELGFELRDLAVLREKLSESKNFSGKAFSQTEKKTMKRVRSLTRQAEDLIGQQLRNMERTIDGLRSLGYIHGDALTPKGVWAANLCTSYVLEIGEAIADKLFDQCSTVDLIAMVASICGDPFRNYAITEQRPLKDEQTLALESVLDRVSILELPGVQSDHEVLDGAANSVLTWINAEGWNEFRALLVLKGIAEGDVSRLITQTAEQLNQIARLYETHPELARKAFEGRKMLLRPPLTEDYSG
jgi:superfamily II RNA helicase